MSHSNWSVGDWIIYRKCKQSASPSPRAKKVTPSKQGENYLYIIEKYWIVTEILEDGSLVATTYTGKQPIISVDDPALRKARFWECWLYRRRFREIEASISPDYSPVQSYEPIEQNRATR